MYRVLSTLIFGGIMSLFLFGGSAAAAPCTSDGSYGTITGTVNIPVTGEYIVWVRLNPPTTPGNVAEIELGGNTCFTLNSTNLSTSSLTWINYAGSSTSAVMKYTFNSTGPAAVKINGLTDDVKIDRVMLIGSSENCSSNGTVPKDTGTNCESGLVVGSGGGGTSSPSTPPPSVTTPAVVTAEPENVAKVEYYVNGELVQASNEATGFDTSLVPNGEYELTTKVTKKDGSVVEQKDTITVSNPPQRFGTLRRWARRNKTTIIAGSVTVAVLSAGAIVLFGFRARHHHRMYLMHHGLGA